MSPRSRYQAAAKLLVLSLVILVSSLTPGTTANADPGAVGNGLAGARRVVTLFKRQDLVLFPGISSEWFEY